jgi:hypothetical protein
VASDYPKIKAWQGEKYPNPLSAAATAAVLFAKVIDSARVFILRHGQKKFCLRPIFPGALTAP